MLVARRNSRAAARPELYHWEPNANSGKPIIAFLEKGISFESHYTDLLEFDQHKPAYVAINPDGTIPTLVHGDALLTESTEMGEYIDAEFEGPPLRPASPIDRWRMRWWGKFLDGYFGPSLSMIGWSVFVGPAVRGKDPEILRRNIERIPLKERRDAWRKAIYNTFGEDELAESGRRVQHGIRVFEAALGERHWFAGESYSLADINAFCMAYALPLMQPAYVNPENTPHLIEWLRRVYARPAIGQAFELGRTPMAARAVEVRELIGAADA
ncbi:MAG TPA: glutathione S-transferase family protein [Woeseiaceae bacterium]|jgi:glutathione S-transferase/GST-like protein|nr:glutathione S-transferase family protein [Woeseiaceae bacterium]